MRITVRNLVARKKNELHANIIIPKEQSEIETEHVIEKNLGESTTERYRRLSMEQEDLYNNPSKAEEYIQKLCSEMEGDQEALLEAAKFYMKRGEHYTEKAEQYLRDAYCFGMKNSNVALLYASMLVQNGRATEASVILKYLAGQGYETTKCYLLLQISADLQGNPTLSEKQKALAMIEHMRSQVKIPECGSTKSREPRSIPPAKSKSNNEEEKDGAPATPKEKSNDVESKPAYNQVRLTIEEENQVYLELAEFLNDKSFSLLSQKCLEYVTDKESVRVRFARAKSLMLL